MPVPAPRVDGVSAGKPGRTGALHPELRLRLRELGIGITSDLLHGLSQGKVVTHTKEADLAPTSCQSEDDWGTAVSTSPCNSFAKEANAKSEGAPEESVDNMLLQLHDLDARSKALQSECNQVYGNKTKVSTSSSKNGSDRKQAVGAGSLGTGPQDQGAVQNISKKHPLDHVEIWAAQGSSRTAADFHCQPHRHRRERPPLPAEESPPSSCSMAVNAGPRRAAKLTIQGSIRSCKVPPSPSSARQTSGKCVALPPLKTSASAPGCLLRGPWVKGNR